MTSTSTTTTYTTKTPDATPVPVFRIKALPNTAFPAIGNAYVKLTGSGAHVAALFTASVNEATTFRLALDPRAAGFATAPGLPTLADDDGYSGSLVALFSNPTSYSAAQIQSGSFASILFEPRSVLTNPAFSGVLFDILCSRPSVVADGALSCAYGDKTYFATDSLISNPNGAYLRLVNSADLPYVVQLSLVVEEVSP